MVYIKRNGRRVYVTRIDVFLSICLFRMLVNSVVTIGKMASCPTYI